MDKIKELSWKKVIAVIFVFMCAYQYLILRVVPKITKYVFQLFGKELLSSDLTTSYTMGIVIRLLGFAGIYVIMKKLDLLKRITSRWSPRYILISIIFIIYIVINFEFAMVEGNKLYLVALMILECVAIGLYEEIFFRGLVLGVFLEKIKVGKNGVFFIVLVSNLMFGLVHIMNAFEKNAQLNVVLSQVVYAFFIGTLFSAIYIRCNYCMWWCVLLHALFDISDELVRIAGFEKGVVTKVAGTVSNWDVFLNDLLMLPLFLTGLFLLRNVNRNKSISE